MLHRDRQPALQATFRSFKLRQESAMDSVCVLVVMMIFVADLHKDLAVVGEADHAWFLGTVFSAGLLVLIVAAALAG
jgi:hypothetical protein